MGVENIAFAICKFPKTVLENGPWKHTKNSWATSYSIAFHYTCIEVTPDISIIIKNWAIV